MCSEPGRNINLNERSDLILSFIIFYEVSQVNIFISNLPCKSGKTHFSCEAACQQWSSKYHALYLRGKGGTIPANINRHQYHRRRTSRHQRVKKERNLSDAMARKQHLATFASALQKHLPDLMGDVIIFAM